LATFPATSSDTVVEHWYRHGTEIENVFRDGNHRKRDQIWRNWNPTSADPWIVCSGRRGRRVGSARLTRAALPTRRPAHATCSAAGHGSDVVRSVRSHGHIRPCGTGIEIGGCGLHRLVHAGSNAHHERFGNLGVGATTAQDRG
jgi:hypothetical protein